MTEPPRDLIFGAEATMAFRIWLTDLARAVTPKAGTATLTAGTVTIADKRVSAASRILVTVQQLGTVAAPKPIAVTARTPGVSFTLTSSDATDTSVIAWQLI